MNASRLVLASIATLCALPAAASAMPTADVAATSSDADVTSSIGAKRRQPLSQRYCFVDETAATPRMRRDCATLAEWQIRGIDPRRTNRR